MQPWLRDKHYLAIGFQQRTSFPTTDIETIGTVLILDENNQGKKTKESDEVYPHHLTDNHTVKRTSLNKQDEIFISCTWTLDATIS